MKALARPTLYIGLLLVQLSLVPPPAARGATTATPGWLGPSPGQGVPDAELLRRGHEACAEAKGKAARARLDAGRDNGPGPLREDDPFTFYDVTYYHLSLGVFQGNESLDGMCMILLTSLRDGLDEVVLHAAPNLTISSVEQVPDDAAFTRDGDELTIQLPNPLDEGDMASIMILYSAAFNGCGVLSSWETNVQTGQSIHTFTTQSEPFDARCWWPCKDDTRDKADSMSIAVTTDDFNTVVCNGVLRSDVDHGNGTRTVTWFEGWPMVTYLLSMCVTEYNHAQSTWSWNEVNMPMHDWSWSLGAADQQNVMLAGRMSLTALSDRYGCYPFWDEKYGHAQYTWGGAMEHQTCTSMGFYDELVVAHEASHQWFGDKVTCHTFHDIWLNEGWATFSEALYCETWYGMDTYHLVMGYNAYLGSGTIYVEDPEHQNIFDGNLSYAKGSWVVHMLRHVMGEDAFWTGVHNYLGPNERPAHRTSDTDGFRQIMEAQYGGDLSWFFDQWIMGEYFPDYAYHWDTHTVGEQVFLDLQLIQRQVPNRQLFTMPVDLRVTYEGGASHTFVLWNDQAAQSYELELAGAPVSVELDPESWILDLVTELSSPPPTNVVLGGARLLDEQGAPIARIPAGGAFQVELTLANQGLSAAPLGLALGTAHPDIELSGPTSLDELPFGQSVTLSWQGSAAAGISGMVDLNFSANWEGGSLSRQLRYPAGHPEVLLVDDDGGDAYEAWYQNAMNGALDYVTATPDSLPELAGFGLLLWITGDNRRALAEAEWDQVLAWRDGGGHLVFTGQNFLDAQEAGVISQRLGLEMIDANHDDNAVMGEAGRLFNGRPFYLFNGGAGNQDQMDVFYSIIDCSETLAHYNHAAQGSAAEEMICGEGGLITFGFGLEGVADIGNGISLPEVLQTLAAWSRGETGVEPPTPAWPAADFTLLGAHPNPFNPATTLEWSAARAGLLGGEIVNLAGQVVERIAPRQVAAGRGRLLWQAAGHASGLYLARLELTTPDGRRQAAATKLMLLQ